MKKNKKIKFVTPLFAALMLLCALRGAASELALTLDDAIARARSQSVSAAVALNELRTSYWEYRTYRADLLPEVNFKATLPGYYKQYSTYQAADGTYTFVRNNYLQMTGEFSIDQNIWLTGGRLSVNTSLDFLRQLDGERYNRFLSIPVALTLNQPVFGVNNVKWNRRIEPLRYAEAKARFLSATEEVAMQTVQYFFDLLMANENLGIARQNHDNAAKLYDVAKVKREMGQISENDLLQMRLNLLNARSAMTSSESTVKSCMFRLRSFLSLSDDVELQPVVPAAMPLVGIDFNDALTRALESNMFAKNTRRRQLEADYQIAKAKGDMRQISLYAQVGYTGTASEIDAAYQGLRSNQVVEVGVRVPILDWGKRRGAVKVAQSNREVVESRVRQETLDFSQNLFILVERFNNQRQQLEIADEADEIAHRRYNSNVETYLIGKISTLDLNDSQTRKDEARQAYINELFYYWYYYYQIRSITLWDYARMTGIEADIEKIVRN